MLIVLKHVYSLAARVTEISLGTARWTKEIMELSKDLLTSISILYNLVTEISTSPVSVNPGYKGKVYFYSVADQNIK